MGSYTLIVDVHLVHMWFIGGLFIFSCTCTRFPSIRPDRRWLGRLLPASRSADCSIPLIHARLLLHQANIHAIPIRATLQLLL